VGSLEREEAALLAAEDAKRSSAEVGKVGAATVEGEAKFDAAEARLELLERQVEAVLPVWEKLGGLLKFSLPRHMEDKALTLLSLDTYLTAVEDSIAEKVGLASGICAARAPPPVEEEEEGTTFTKPQEPPDESDSLILLKEFIKPRRLSTYNPAAKLQKRGSADDTLLEMA